MAVTPGAPVTPDNLADMDFIHIDINPTEGTAAEAIAFNHGVSIYVDNVDVDGNVGSRFWLDVADNADVVIGPRSGSNTIETLRLRTDRTTASAANMHIDSANYTISRSTSSRKYKTGIEDYSTDNEQILKVRPVSFYDKREYDKAEKGEKGSGSDCKRHVGLIAEELHDLGLGAYVEYLDGEPDAINYDRLVIPLIGVVKKLEQRIKALERRNN
jgi:hypothetical protein